MKIRDTIAFLLLPVVAGIALSIDPAAAHRFDVALVIPVSGAGSAQGRQIHDGFMLATTERDSHPDQESDGHLGGLDVYVSVIDGNGDVAADIGSVATRGDIDIVAAFGPEKTLSLIGKLLDGTKIALLLPGRSPIPGSDLPAVAAFMTAYHGEHGSRPSSRAARGYDAARRIDAAVRDQGGVDDTASLRRRLGENARPFNW